MLYTGCFKDIDPKKYDEIWIIVRQLKAVPRNPLGNIKHVRVLSPSSRLLYDTLEMKKQGRWNKDVFDNNYAPRFMREMLESPAAMIELRKLATLSETKDILMVCYCPDEGLCHRSLVKKIIETMQED